MQSLVHLNPWTPRISEVLFVKLERDNRHDKHAVIEDGITVGYVPREICKNVYYFMKHDGNIAFCETTGECCNCGAGFGVEIPCMFQVLWPSNACCKTKMQTARFV